MADKVVMSVLIFICTFVINLTLSAFVGQPPPHPWFPYFLYKNILGYILPVPKYPWLPYFLGQNILGYHISCTKASLITILPVQNILC